MNQFNIFLDFYRIIAEMTEEEIVSAIGSPKYRINPEKPDVPLNKNDAFQKVQKRHVQEKR